MSTPPSLDQLLGPIVLALAGIAMLVAPECWIGRRAADYDRRIAERLERGHDRYFEELRTLQSYRRPLSVRMMRITGLVVLTIAAAIAYQIVSE